MHIEKLYIGTWFQRTTLHLSELWKLIDSHGPKTLFIENDLVPLRELLDLASSERMSLEFECIRFTTRGGISGTIYEDGLMIVSLDGVMDIKKAKETLRNYYENNLLKGVTYLFSKGAPIPKELANIPTLLPYMFVVSDGSDADIETSFFTEERLHGVVKGKKTSIFKGSSTLVLHNPTSEKQATLIVETHIFFREFKVQLERYLSIHRTLWEKIKVIFESDKIKGTDIDPLRTELQGYQKTINLIEARINQMPAYVKTRQKLTVIEGDDDLVPITALRFEDLLDTHEYIKHLWTMTKNYLQSALDMLLALQAESTKTSISSLQLVTTIGVISGLIAYLGKDTLPPFTKFGLFYLVGLLAVTWCINSLISWIFKRRMYTVSKHRSAKIL
ncbi:MAG: hypothetical protein V4665_02325 [Patescibacteria group bacterium]